MTYIHPTLIALADVESLGPLASDRPGAIKPDSDHVPLVTDGWRQKEEDELVLNNEVANARFMVGGTANRRSGKKCSSFP
jgi:hypothetical protein